MNYSLLSLTSVSDCDALIQTAILEKAEIDNKKYQLENQVDETGEQLIFAVEVDL